MHLNLSLRAAYGKITCLMNSQTEQSVLKLPRLIPVLTAGFNTVANHISLILIPVALDLLLWFAPKLSVKNLIMPFINEMLSTVAKLGNTDLSTTLGTSQKLWTDLLGQYSLLGALRTIPVGVPSILARTGYTVNPMGSPMVFEIPNATMAVLIFIGLTLIGFFVGTLYINLLSRSTAPENEVAQPNHLWMKFSQSVWMAVYLLVLGLFLIVPFTFVLSLFSVLGSGVSQVLIMIAGLVLLWMLIPLAFSVHGIFVMQQKAMPSMMLSTKMIRFFLPGTGSFILICALISEGLNMLWTNTPPNSWLTLIGIIAHAFVVTALLASTFIYYRQGLRWMQGNLQKMSEMASKRPDNGGFIGRNQ